MCYRSCMSGFWVDCKSFIRAEMGTPENGLMWYNSLQKGCCAKLLVCATPNGRIIKIETYPTRASMKHDSKRYYSFSSERLISPISTNDNMLDGFEPPMTKKKETNEPENNAILQLFSTLSLHQPLRISTSTRKFVSMSSKKPRAVPT